MSDPSTRSRPASTKKSPKKTSAKREDARASSEGVLANLPRTRPQRSSARRDASRRTAPGQKTEPIGALPAKPRPTAAARTKPAAKAKATPRPVSASARKPRRTATKAQATEARAPAQATAKTRPAKVKRPAKPLDDPAPRQGFETERDPLTGSLQPPAGVDLFTSAAELAGELTKTGLSAGGRLLKDALARLPLN